MEKENLLEKFLKAVIRTKPGEGHWAPIYGAFAEEKDVSNLEYKDRSDLGSWGWFAYQAGWISAAALVLNYLNK
ncbi:hypothetical protein HY212_07540 [Candidatus Pacearchaeota archaeon]|nr:hypothetical protein [Candidatus Pacearchaeota archaeon]